VPHRDDLEAAHARIAALERDKDARDRRIDELEAELEQELRDEPPDTRLVVVEEDRGRQAIVARHLIRLQARVGEPEILEAIDRAMSLRDPERTVDGELVWRGRYHHRRVELTMSRRAEGLYFRATAVPPPSDGFGPVLGMIAAVMFVAAAGVGLWPVALPLLAGAMFWSFRRKRARHEQLRAELDEGLERIAGLLE
jgi:hypothetical protein